MFYDKEADPYWTKYYSFELDIQKHEVALRREKILQEKRRNLKINLKAARKMARQNRSDSLPLTTLSNQDIL